MMAWLRAEAWLHAKIWLHAEALPRARALLRKRALLRERTVLRLKAVPRHALRAAPGCAHDRDRVAACRVRRVNVHGRAARADARSHRKHRCGLRNRLRRAECSVRSASRSPPSTSGRAA